MTPRKRAPKPYRRLAEHPVGELGRALASKARRRLAGKGTLEPVADFDGWTIFDRADLHGGGLDFGLDFARLLKDLGIASVPRLCEFCAGPGYIGYWLLRLGLCEHLVLLEKNGDATAAARRSAEENDIQSVTIYQSDGLQNIPAAERWDLVVGNPPHFATAEAKHPPLVLDQGWKLHRDFYADVRRFLAPGARVILQEHEKGSSPEIFAPMIAAGGGRLAAVKAGPNLPGYDGAIYYVVSEWD